MIDYWALSKNFDVGDFVQMYAPSRSVSLGPYVGRVTAVLPGIGFLDVQWPFGNQRMSPEDLVKVNKEFAQYLPPSVNFSYYPGLEQLTKGKQASANKWRSTELPPGFHKELAKIFHHGTGEVRAYDELWHRYASYADDAALRDEVAKFYRFASNAVDLFLEEYARKTATYWYSQNRTHRATRAEVDSKCPNCPKCGTSMRKATYKMAEGQKIKLFACPKDLYLIKQNDIHGPEGEPVGW